MTLTILLDPNNPDTAALWYDRARNEGGRDTSLADLAPRSHGEQNGGVCLAVAGEDALTRVIRLPMKNRRDLERAAGLVLDDQMAGPIEQRVLAFSDANQDGDRLVTALPSGSVEMALEVAKGNGLDPDILTVDHALLPLQAEEGACVRLAVGDRVVVSGVEGAFTAEADFASVFFERLGPEAIDDLDISDLVSLGAPNFRVGKFRKRSPLPDIRSLGLAASLLAAAGIVFLAGSLVEGIRYAGAAETLRDEAQANFAAAFPGTPALDIERQVQRRGSAQMSSDFLPLTAVLADVLASQETTALASLAYNNEGQLTAELVFEAMTDLETVTRVLAERGVLTEEGTDVRRDDGRLVTRLILTVA